MQGEDLESVIQDLASKVNLLRTADENNRSVILSDLMRNINNFSENSKNHGIPPPHDELSMCSNSFISDNDSLSSEVIEEINHLESISDIKNCNAEMKNAVKQSIGVFHSVSREFVNKSISGDKTTVIVNQLNNLKRNLAEAIEESRISRSSFTSMIDDGSEAKELQEIFQQIERIQNEILNAGKKLAESEEEIMRTDKENSQLKGLLMKLDGSLEQVLEIELDGRKDACGCTVY